MGKRTMDFKVSYLGECWMNIKLELEPGPFNIDLFLLTKTTKLVAKKVGSNCGMKIIIKL